MTKPKAKEQKSLIDFEVPKQKTNTEQTKNINEVPFHELNLGQDEQKEQEPLEMTQSLVPQPSDLMDMEATTKDETEGGGQMDMKTRLQKEAEKFEMYDRIYVGQLSEEEASNKEIDESAYS